VTGTPPNHDRWLPDGRTYFDSLEAGLRAAVRSIRLESYIVSNDSTGRRIRDTLVAAARRGVSVSVLIDGLGAVKLPSDWWKPLTDAGGKVQVFNPTTSRRIGIRDHRKLVVTDDQHAWLGGINLANKYAGDGLNQGWADLGYELHGPPAVQLAAEFDAMSAECSEPQPEVVIGRIRRGPRPPARDLAPGMQLMLSGPGRMANAFQKALRADIASALRVQFAVAYFLPGYRMRRLLRGVAVRGVPVQILVPGRTDVAIARRAARHLYAGLLRAGVELWEYQPQVLHVKLFLTDRAAYVGSSNLDTRSLHINYELMLRLADPDRVAEGRQIFETLRSRSKRVDPVAWFHSRSWLERWRDGLAYWILSRADPYVTRWLAMDPR
jgi:cardiolipin synthase